MHGRCATPCDVPLTAYPEPCARHQVHCPPSAAQGAASALPLPAPRCSAELARPSLTIAAPRSPTQTCRIRGVPTSQVIRSARFCLLSRQLVPAVRGAPGVPVRQRESEPTAVQRWQWRAEICTKSRDQMRHKNTSMRGPKSIPALVTFNLYSQLYLKIRFVSREKRGATEGKPQRTGRVNGAALAT